jgi:hypothetical protein
MKTRSTQKTPVLHICLHVVSCYVSVADSPAGSSSANCSRPLVHVPEYLDLLEGLTARDPASRPSAQAATLTIRAII